MVENFLNGHRRAKEQSFCLLAKLKRWTVEIPMGMTVRDVIFDIGGGSNDKQFKAVQMGGPSGGCIPASLIDTVIDYNHLSNWYIMGSGG